MADLDFPAATTTPDRASGPPLISLAAVPWDLPLVGRIRMLTESWKRAGERAVFVELTSVRSALRTGARQRAPEPGRTGERIHSTGSHEHS